MSSQNNIHSATIAQLRAIGADVTTVTLGQGALQLVVRHRGATVDVWPKSGRWRARMVGVPFTRVQRSGINVLIATLTQPQLPEWMTRRAS